MKCTFSMADGHAKHNHAPKPVLPDDRREGIHDISGSFAPAIAHLKQEHGQSGAPDDEGADK